MPAGFDDDSEDDDFYDLPEGAVIIGASVPSVKAPSPSPPNLSRDPRLRPASFAPTIDHDVCSTAVGCLVVSQIDVVMLQKNGRSRVTVSCSRLPLSVRL